MGWDFRARAAWLLRGWLSLSLVPAPLPDVSLRQDVVREMAVRTDMTRLCLPRLRSRSRRSILQEEHLPLPPEMSGYFRLQPRRQAVQSVARGHILPPWSLPRSPVPSTPPTWRCRAAISARPIRRRAEDQPAAAIVAPIPGAQHASGMETSSSHIRKADSLACRRSTCRAHNLSSSVHAGRWWRRVATPSRSIRFIVLRRHTTKTYSNTACG
jgi:hypothetical protein